MPGSEKGKRKYLSMPLSIVNAAINLMPIPFAGEVKEIYFAADAKPTTGTYACIKQPTGGTLLTATTIDINALTAYTATAAPVNAGPNCKLSAGDCLKFTSAVSSTGSCTAISVTVGIDPDQI